MQCLMTPEMPSPPKIYDTVFYTCSNGVKDYISAELLHCKGEKYVIDGGFTADCVLLIKTELESPYSFHKGQ